MKVLIAEDDDISRRILENMLRRWNYEVLLAEDGNAAWEILQKEDGPRIAVLDWVMPGMSGLEICRKARTLRPIYVILLTSKTLAEDITTGIESGADDYITKPFSPLDLRARLRVGERLIQLQGSIAARVQELSASTSDESDGPLVSVCSYCKKLRDDQDCWQQLESYVAALIQGRITHGICPDCYQRALGEWEARKSQLNPEIRYETR